jgi:hypothetical protein
MSTAHRPSCADASWEDELTLFVRTADALHPVLRGLPMSHWKAVKGCLGQWERLVFERAGQKRDPVLSFEGTTDAEGRSVYVRAAFPITPDRLYFVEKIGTGPYKRSPRLVRATDGLAIPGMHYKVTWCGAPYVGVSDEQGNGAEFRSEDPDCKISVQFFKLASELKK